MTRTAGKIKELLFPPVCIFCRRLLLHERDRFSYEQIGTPSVCSSCLANLPYKPFEEHFTACLSNPYPGDPIPDLKVIVPFRYEKDIVSALRAMKFHDAPYIAKTLSYFMAHSVLYHTECFDAVIPVPLSSQRLRKRGYNQAALLADSIAEKMDTPCLKGFLLRRRNTKQQSRFRDPARRAVNVDSAFMVPEDVSIEGLRILLVDDVFTTGNTLHEAALALFSAGAASVTAITAASGRKDQP
ncbi:MAG: ComF family protein [Clostridiaceae bacterium]|nr:ComF family protein [Clostridiaceae bacterium]